MDPVSFKYIAIGLMAFAMLGSAIGVGNIFAALMESISRNPSAEDKLVPRALIGAGMAEAMGIFGLIVALMLFTQ